LDKFHTFYTTFFFKSVQGTTYGIVPYLAPRRMGVIAGLVGAGGNAGAFAWNTIWARLGDKNPSRWFWILGINILEDSKTYNFW
jgi:NNP family nitrate/nitrite transporter-like MFS transporter